MEGEKKERKKKIITRWFSPEIKLNRLGEWYCGIVLEDHSPGNQRESSAEIFRSICIA